MSVLKQSSWQKSDLNWKNFASIGANNRCPDLRNEFLLCFVHGRDLPLQLGVFRRQLTTASAYNRDSPCKQQQRQIHHFKPVYTRMVMGQSQLFLSI